MQLIKIEIDRTQAGKTALAILRSAFPGAQLSMLYKAFDSRDVKTGTTRIDKNYRPAIGEILNIYLGDEIFIDEYMPHEPEGIYEDDNLLVVFKPAGMITCATAGSDSKESAESLLSASRGFIKACHRLDRNTEGLVIFAKKPEYLDEIHTLLNENHIQKYYTAVVSGVMKCRNKTFEAYLFKDSKKSMVYITETKKPGYVKIVTECTSLRQTGENTVLEVRLHTGRTHQIRAHLAFLGHPVIGDGKYGSNEINKKSSAKHQLLCASKLVFNIQRESKLSYMHGKTLSVRPSFDSGL